MLEKETNLTNYQVKKFTYFFKAFFDHDDNGYIEWNDIEDLGKRMITFAKFEEDGLDARALRDLLENFFSCLVDETKSPDSPLKMRTQGQVSLQRWLTMWGQITSNVKGLSDLPYWLLVLCRALFCVIDSNNDSVIDKYELKKYYQEFLLLDAGNSDILVHEAFVQMTANGEYPLDIGLFQQVFSSFIVGKNHHGPGKFVVGYFDPEEEAKPFKIEDCAYEDDCTDAGSPNKQWKPTVVQLPKIRNYWIGEKY